MLSYQHAFHAGNAADVHKHAILSWVLDYLTRKDKALSYVETHSGRGLYDLGSAEAGKTGEAAQGIERLLDLFDPQHPYPTTVNAIRSELGPAAYPGSPLIASRLLRAFDHLHLAELHPKEHAALVDAIPARPNTRIYHRDGLEMANALIPPDPRRGLCMIDPAWEVKDEYDKVARLIPKLVRKWNVGIVLLWYPVLRDNRHRPMIRALTTALPDAKVHEVAFPPAREGHGMIGSGMFMVNPPWGIDDETKRLDRIFGRV